MSGIVAFAILLSLMIIYPIIFAVRGVGGIIHQRLLLIRPGKEPLMIYGQRARFMGVMYLLLSLGFGSLITFFVFYFTISIVYVWG